MGPIFLVHDSCATESMGPIYDRAQEHLGVSDMTVIAVRRFLLRALRAVEAGPGAAPCDPHRGPERFASSRPVLPAKFPRTWTRKLYVTEQLKKEKYWETNL
jgi:hypothetical protein